MSRSKAYEAKIYGRLTQHLSLPGRVEELIVFLDLNTGNMPGWDAASAKVALAILQQLKLRIPPELERLAAVLEELEAVAAPQGPHGPGRSGGPEGPRHPPDLPLLHKVAVLWSQILGMLVIAFLLFAGIFIWEGQNLLAVILLVVLFIIIGFVVICLWTTQAPRSISEAQFLFQAHEGRRHYVDRGMLIGRGGNAA